MATTAGQTVLVLGGGIGGVAAANRLRRGLDRRHKVILVNRDPDFTFAASYLWVMTGKHRPAQVTRLLHQLGRRGIEVVIGDVEHIDPATRTVTVAGRKLTADHLVVALASYQRCDLALPQLSHPASRLRNLPRPRNAQEVLREGAVAFVLSGDDPGTGALCDVLGGRGERLAGNLHRSLPGIGGAVRAESNCCTPNQRTVRRAAGPAGGGDELRRERAVGAKLSGASSLNEVSTGPAS